MEANVKAVIAEATEVDTELNGSSNIVGMVVVDNRGLCIAAEVDFWPFLHIKDFLAFIRVKEIPSVPASSSP